MIEYYFRYNVPSYRSSFELNNTYIDVRATLLPDNQIALEFPMLGAGTLLEVHKHWDGIIDDMRSIAATEFQMMIAVSSTTSMLNKAIA